MYNRHFGVSFPNGPWEGNPEVSTGSEFGQWKCYVIVKDAIGLVLFPSLHGAINCFLKFYSPTPWCLCCYGGMSLAWVSRLPLKIDRPK